MTPPKKPAKGKAKRRKPKAKPAVDPLAGPEPKPSRCVAKTAAKKRCKRTALKGTDRCSVHVGAPVGRPTKLDAKTTERIVQMLGAGGPLETAAAAAGVGKRTFYDWLERGDPDGTEKANEPFRVFRERVEIARREGEQRHVLAIATNPDWRARAWLLSRTNPDQFAPRRGGPKGSVHPDDLAAGETSAGGDIQDDQVGPDGSPL